MLNPFQSLHIQASPEKGRHFCLVCSSEQALRYLPTLKSISTSISCFPDESFGIQQLHTANNTRSILISATVIDKRRQDVQPERFVEGP